MENHILQTIRSFIAQLGTKNNLIPYLLPWALTVIDFKIYVLTAMNVNCYWLSEPHMFVLSEKNKDINVIYQLNSKHTELIIMDTIWRTTKTGMMPLLSAMTS